jgi:hypothetical protein
MSLLHIGGEGTRIGQRICDRAGLLIEIEVQSARGVGQDRPGVALGVVAPEGMDPISLNPSKRALNCSAQA